jgi:phosphoglycolate phosphatase-like HAD superfamily hydrolase
MNELRSAATASDLVGVSWIEVLNPDAVLGRVRHALFDFDGTISVIRRGWEAVMIPMMVEMIVGDRPADPEIEAEVAEYVDRSTGILTIKQMAWLEETVKRYGLNPDRRTARAYKAIYNERLLEPVRERLRSAGEDGDVSETLTIAGAVDFLAGLRDRGVALYLASGTDHEYVLREAAALGVSRFFGDEIYGAMDDTAAYTKKRIIQRILDDHDLRGGELMVVGDGPVEIREAARRGALTLGVAADEDRRQGLDPRKRRRLIDAGADLIVTDFRHDEALIAWLVGA